MADKALAYKALDKANRTCTPGDAWAAIDAAKVAGVEIADLEAGMAYSIGDKVVIPAGYSVGMGTLKVATPAVVAGMDHTEGTEAREVFYTLLWADRKGRARTTYYNPLRDMPLGKL